MSLPNYLCPLCKSPLQLNNSTFTCQQNHSFDKAKEGYVNLLPVQHKNSKDPGDNKAMVNARRAFLEKQFYKPLIDELVCLQQHYQNESNTVLDAGCGEGYYTHQHKNTTNEVYGVDIAKNAVRLAAKKYKNCHFSVGTLSLLPFADEFFDWIFSIYAPILEEEFTRVLKHDAYLLTVTPAENHLIELKAMIYREAQAHDSSKLAIKDLTLVEEKRLNYPMNFDNGEDIINLLSMTPFAFKTTEQLLTDLQHKTEFTCQADFKIRLYKK